MRGLLADVNVQGQFETMVEQIWCSPEWAELWESLKLTVESFSSLQLDSDETDDVIWERCQEEGLILFTANRNHDGPDSLEVVIQSRALPSSLPVITISSPQRFASVRSYAEEVAIRVLEILLDVENYRGCGRIYVP
jgi:hypothetical protein